MADTTGQYRAIHAALMAWFHGGAHYPYAATGHGTDPEECWQCHEAAQVAAEVTAKGPSGLLHSTPEPAPQCKGETR